MNFKLARISIYFLFSSLVFSLACSQPCTLSPEKAPEIRGFRLLMSVDEIKAKYQGFPTPKANEFGLAKVVIAKNTNIRSSEKYETLANEVTLVDGSNYPELKGVNRVYLDIVDSRIASIKVYYSNDLKWTSVDEFVKKTAESLELKGTWENKSENYRSLSCSNLLIFAGIEKDYSQQDSIEKLPYIEFDAIRLTFEPKMREYRKNSNANLKEQEQRNSFNP